MNILLILAATLPGILVIVLIYYMDKYEKEEKLPIIICFTLGVLCTLPVIELNKTGLSKLFNNPKEILPTLFYAFIYIAVVEELIKLLVLLLYPYRQAFFNEPFDGIIYAVAIAMGFATLENFLYASTQKLDLIILRAFTAVPAHASFAVMQGYFVGKAKFNPKKQVQLIGFGLLVSVITHGLYDFFIIQEKFEGLIIAAIFTLSICIFMALRLIAAHQKESPFNPSDPPQKNDT